MTLPGTADVPSASPSLRRVVHGMPCPDLMISSCPTSIYKPSIHTQKWQGV